MKTLRIFLTITASVGLLALAGSGCSDSSSPVNTAALGALCTQLDAKQNELDCKVAALSTTCAAGDTACANSKSSALAACDSLTPSNYTSTRTSACAAMGIPITTVTSTSVGTSTGTTTSTGSSTGSSTSTSTSTGS